MGELETGGQGQDPFQRNPAPNAAQAPRGVEAQTEHLSRLHKMSTTAGIATQEYVAINSMAIAAAVVGLATAVVLTGYTVFLVLAVAGVVCGVLALQQIRDSAGTQGGRGIAVLGIVLSLLFGGIGIARMVLDARRERADAVLLAQAIKDLGATLAAGEFKKAYESTDPVFQRTHPYTRWEQVFKGQAEAFGKLTKFEGNGIVQFTTLADGTYTGVTMIVAQWEKRLGEDARLATYLTPDETGKWRIYRIIQGFEDQQNRARGGGGGGAGGAAGGSSAPLGGAPGSAGH